jgi:unsaturated rhamnogalacturonyl hydrolase
LRDNLRAQVRDGRPHWSTPDALNMSLPSFTRIAVDDRDQAMLDYAHKSFRALQKRTYNEHAGLWSAHTQTNGWAVQGLAKAVLNLPADSPARADFARTLKKSVSALVRFQRPDGSFASTVWGRDFEAASTAMITYAIAAGINANVLDRPTYLPFVQKGWQALATRALAADGKFGYVQARGSSVPASAGDTAGFAVGSFLLAGQQVVPLTPGC